MLDTSTTSGPTSDGAISASTTAPICEMPPHYTWEAQSPVKRAASLWARLKSSGLPLGAPASGDANEGDGDADAGAGSIIALVAVTESKAAALVATPSGLVYRFEPEQIDPAWWAFAATNYYVVTGNQVDRQQLAQLAGVESKAIKGRAWNRKKMTDPTNLSLDELIELVAPDKTGEQGELF